MIKFTIDT